MDNVMLVCLINIANGVKYTVMYDECEALVARGLAARETEAVTRDSTWGVTDDGIEFLNTSDKVATCIGCAEYRHILSMKEYHGVVLCPNCIEEHKRGLLPDCRLDELRMRT